MWTEVPAIDTVIQKWEKWAATDKMDSELIKKKSSQVEIPGDFTNKIAHTSHDMEKWVDFWADLENSPETQRYNNPGLT